MADGKHVDVKFSAVVYQSKYNTHLNDLNEFNENTKDANIVPCLCKQLLKHVRCVALILAFGIS